MPDSTDSAPSIAGQDGRLRVVSHDLLAPRPLRAEDRAAPVCSDAFRGLNSVAHVATLDSPRLWPPHRAGPPRSRLRDDRSLRAVTARDFLTMPMSDRAGEQIRL